jgi:hypothetical protein
MIKERVLSRAQVDDKAYNVLMAYYGKDGLTVSAPIDVDMIAEAHFGLTLEWDVIEDPIAKQLSFAPGGVRAILGGLYPRTRRIVLNEEHVELFRAKPGLERFTKGHEIGHWVLHIDHAALESPQLFDFDCDGEAIICRDGDDTWIERQANWFAASLLMPKELLLSISTEYDLMQWRSRYRMAERFGVTISAMSTRLNQLGLSYVDEAGKIYGSAAQAAGQSSIRV